MFCLNIVVVQQHFVHIEIEMCIESSSVDNNNDNDDSSSSCSSRQRRNVMTHKKRGSQSVSSRVPGEYYSRCWHMHHLINLA